jgi:DNA polymerase I-like protein with 3'-5' exonuclease and polymerase domains
MILSQLLHAGAKVEPLKRGQTSHSLASVVERELGLELDKTHQNSDWAGTLTPEMIEYAAKDVHVLLPLYEVLQAKIGEADLTYVAEIEHRALPAVVWMSSAGVPIDADGWREHARRTEADAARLKDKLKALAPEHPEGEVWNFGSPQQVRRAAKLLGVDLPDTRDETLARFAKEHNFIATLRDYRKASKLASTYGAGWRADTTGMVASARPGGSYGQPPAGWPATTPTCRTSRARVPLEATPARGPHLRHRGLL